MDAGVVIACEAALGHDYRIFQDFRILNPSAFEVLRNFSRGIGARQACQSATGMRAGAAQVQSLKRSSILRPANQRTEREKLIERLFAVVNVSAAETVSLFEIERRDYLAGNDQIAQARGVVFQLIDHVSSKLVSTCGPIALPQLVRRELNVNRHHVFA